MYYKNEILDPDDDDGTMPQSKEDLAEAVVGHKIVNVERVHYGATVLTLDNGKKVKMVETADCCAFTEVRSFLLRPDRVDHVITGVGTTEGYTRWHIFADMGDVLELTVNWSCGNPFYYGYGFDIVVED